VAERPAHLLVDTSVWVSAFRSDEHHHNHSAQFLAAAAKHGHSIIVPDTVRVEVGCAMARRGGDQLARDAVTTLLEHPTAQRLPLVAEQLGLALRLGPKFRLRALDALIIAAAAASAATLVSWDDELIDRAGAVTPERWVASLG
jgi:predicted nucleic acid-binding protein